MNKYVFRLICFCFAFSILSCGHHVQSPEKLDPESVDIESIDTQGNLGGQITIDGLSSSDVQGPFIEGVKEQSPPDARRNKSLALILGPGLNRAIFYASLLNSLEKNKVPVHYIIGVGYGAIVASMYASGMTGSKIEWCFHNFFNKIKNKEPFSRSWNNAVSEYLVSKINISRIEQAQKVLIIPSINQQTKSIVYTKRGDLKAALEFNYNFPEYLEDGYDFGQFDFYNVSFFKKSGVDLSVAINILNDISFRENDEEYVSGYEKMKIGFEKIRNQVDIYYSLPIKNVFMDHPENVPELLLKISQASDKLSKIIVEKLKM